MAEALNPNPDYFFTDGPIEVQRLNAQYLLLKDVFGHPDFLPTIIDQSNLIRILDAAAGTAVWALDFAAQNESRSLDIFASDITLSKFPPDHILKRSGVKAFEHDLTKPFPDNMRGTFDLVHISMLNMALSEDAWKLALSNIYDVLAPSGYLLSLETDPMAYAHDQSPPDGVLPDLNQVMNGSTGVHAANMIFTGYALRKKFITSLSCRMGALLTSASFSVLSRERTLAPMGTIGESATGMRGAPLAKHKGAMAPHTYCGALSKILYDEGILEVPKGVKIETEEQRQAVIAKIKETEQENGMLVIVSEWVAQKMANS